MIGECTLEAKKESDHRQGLGRLGLRVPADMELNMVMSGKVEEYWYNLTAPLEDYPTKRGSNKVTPNFYEDMLEIAGYLTEDDIKPLEQLCDRYGSNYTVTDNKSTGRITRRVQFKYEDVVKLGMPTEYESLGKLPRMYDSPLKEYDNEGNEKHRYYQIDQHVYLTFWNIAGRYPYKAILSYNPNRFVTEKPYCDYEPVLVFAQTYILDRFRSPWVHRLDLNCDLLVKDVDNMKLEATDGKKHKRQLWSDHDSRYCSGHNGVKLVRYNKSLERLNNSKASRHGYIHLEELHELSEVSGVEVARLELRLTEYGLKYAIKRELGLIAPRKGKKPDPFLPRWLKVSYKFSKDGKLKQHGFYQVLENRCLEAYNVLKGLPLVTNDMITSTRRYDVNAKR